MRTTGVRSVPQVMPRPTQASDAPPPRTPPQPLPRTKFPLHTASAITSPLTPPVQQRTSHKSPLKTPVRTPPPPPSQSLFTPNTNTPPPKPPRSKISRDEDSHDTTVLPRRPGLMDVLSRPPQAASALRPTRPAPQAKNSAQGSSRPRLDPLLLPPLPNTAPPRPPESIKSSRPSRSSATPPVTSRHATQPSASALASPPLAIGLCSSSGLQSPVCTGEDFEETCRKVFHSIKAAKQFSERGKHVQAVTHYQKALTEVDRVLQAQVLSLSNYEPTRQRFFLMQQEVFSLRKEALNGFTDAQTAVRVPRGLSPPPHAPGAPPSYDDVIKEDTQRMRDDGLRPVRSSVARVPESSRSHVVSSTRNHQPRPRPVSSHPPAPHGSTSRLRSNSGGESRQGELVDVNIRPRNPTTGPSPEHTHSTFRPTLLSSTRPKTYHPFSHSLQSLQPPPAVSGHSSLPPPLVPISIPPPLVPVAPPPTNLTSLASETASKPCPTPSTPVNAMDEMVISQTKALRVYEDEKNLSALPDATLPHPPKTSLPTDKDSSQPRRDKENTDNDTPTLQDPTETSGNFTSTANEESNPEPSSASSLCDPFLAVDPFPPIKPQMEDNEVMFSEEGEDKVKPVVSDTHPHPDHDHSQAFTDDFNFKASPTTNSNTAHDSPNTSTTQNSTQLFGDSILEALDCAITPGSCHRRVSPQVSKERTTRFYSEENLLDSSHNTFEAMLRSTRDRCASRASIIEEFDPLLTSENLQDTMEHDEEEEEEGEEEEIEEVFEQKGRKDWREETGDWELEQERKERKKSETKSEFSKSASRIAFQSISKTHRETLTDEIEREEGAYNPPLDYYGEGGAVALEDEVEKYQYYASMRQPKNHHPPDETKARPSYSSQDSAIYSLDSECSFKSPSSPSALMYPSISPEEDRMGQSTIYLPPSRQGDVMRTRKSLMTIREGVKIYFIHTDDVITSPWKKPFLSVYIDPVKETQCGPRLVVSVGSSLWSCELHSKSTLVLRTMSGSYVFGEVAGKPECKAVAVRVPSTVRRVQHEMLSNLLQQNTAMEEERPKGITKAISKGASSAASRMNKLVEEKSVVPTNTFVRRNSVRALKGVTKRLSSIAQKTGANMKELPQEYKRLQEAADTLAFMLSAKMVQYI